ncbi:PhzF family phenazine biosynthesis protein [Moraxella osloensis]|uniref:PhzF family phenazine biosynthesis protein n=1 Tax=Faucicola osloensis TaxID=34062 RepID=A0A2D2LXU8_FAUOS|nr:PhzF family phenazine biosynthesis protein [Moraxella osloensis]ATR79848.1 PhzF family phenazine biosynthesis protein [Moraxella osloensis]
MLQTYNYHIVNVFAESHFGGNPLAVFPNADGLTDKQMQAIAQQFNLSETVFLLAPTAKHGVQAIADLRIFTPNYELPLAGHPTLGSAFILSQLNALPDQFVLNTVAKPVDITINQNSVVVKIHGFEWSQSHLSKTVLAHASGLQESDISNKAYFINSGTQQILIELANREALKNLQIDKDLLRKINQDNKFKTTEQPSVYYWYQVDDIIYSRMFFEQNHVMVEDSGTGSACANLGAYFISQNQYPIHKRIFQGDYMGRPNRLTLNVDETQTIFVGGNVIAVGKGEFYLPNI